MIYILFYCITFKEILQDNLLKLLIIIKCLKLITYLCFFNVTHKNFELFILRTKTYNLNIAITKMGDIIERLFKIIKLYNRNL